MTNENNSAQTQEIPVPPGGGSWYWTGAKWVSNDPVPVDEPVPAASEPSNTIEQGQ